MAISLRADQIKKDLLNITPEICIERARLITESYQETEGEPIIIRRAMALRKILTCMSIQIFPSELIVGNQGSKMRCAPIYPEYAWKWILDELESLSSRRSDRYLILEENKSILREILPFWKGKSLFDNVEKRLSKVQIEATEIGVVEWEGLVTAGDGHITVDFEKVLNHGLSGVVKEAEFALSKLDPTNPADLKKEPFLRAIRIAFQAASEFILRFAALSSQMAFADPSIRRKKELENIGSICAKIAKQPPESFYEALQLTWFIQLILQIESNGHSISFGRIDQYLQRFYQKDLAQGALSHPFCLELVECFYLKIFSICKVRPWAHTRVVAGYPSYQNICLGGQTIDGQDATNDLTYVFLDALANVRLSEPNVYVRCHDLSPNELLAKCVEIVRMGNGMPAFINDKVVVPSLLNRGVHLEDALNYATMGCLEVSVPGKWGYRANGASKFNLLKILELTIHNGQDPKTGIQLCPGNGDLGTFGSFEEVMEEWWHQLDFYIKIHVSIDNLKDLEIEEVAPDVFCSGLINDCINRGKTIKEGGAVYDMQSGSQIGAVNVGNSLAAIKKVVFDEKYVSGKELLDVLAANFEGERGLEIRKKLLDAPKFGNDNDFVDLITKQAFDYYCKSISGYKNTRYGRGPIGGNWFASTVTISSNVPAGSMVGATPDGRKGGEPTNEGISPFKSTVLNGPTAVLKSVAKLSTYLVTGGQLLNMRLSQKQLYSEAGISKLIALIRTFFDLYGWHIQFNVISTVTLREAQKNPQDFRDLVVRVAGYSALFVVLDPDVQEDIISRLEHEL